MSAISKMFPSQHPWSWSRVRVPRSRNLTADVCLVSSLLMVAWPPVCVSGSDSHLSVKLKIIIVIFIPDPSHPPLGLVRNRQHLDPASQCSPQSDAHSSEAQDERIFSVDTFRCEVSVNQRIPTHYRLPPLYLTWN